MAVFQHWSPPLDRICARSTFPPVVRWGCLCLLAALSAPGRAQNVDPREFGLDIPPGPVSRGGGQTVLTVDTERRPVVAKTHAKVGDHLVVLLPDGQLIARSPAEASPTDRKFEPADFDTLLTELATGPLAGFRTKKTRHYVHLYNTSEEFALVASRILESMIPGMQAHAKQQKIATHPPEVPLVAIMFRTEAEFQRFRRMPAGVVAYYHITSNHIVMYEESELWRIKPDLAIQESISTIAHEGAHQIQHNIGVQQRLSRWPMWLSEGMAEYYAPTSFGRNLRWKGAGQVNDLRMFNLELFLKGRAADTPSGQMVEHTVAAARLTATGYAAAWSLTHYLSKNHRDTFHEYLRSISQLGPFEGLSDIAEPGIVPQNLASFRQHFGDDFAQLEAGLVKHLNALPYTDPFADWPHYLAAVEIGTGRRPRREANLFHSRSMADKWVGELIGGLTADQQRVTRHEVLTFPNRAQASQSARQFLATGR